MALILVPGQLERFIGTFYRTNARRPPARPDVQVGEPLTWLMIAKGTLRLKLGENIITVDIPPSEQVTREQYLTFLPLLVNQLVELLGVMHLTNDIHNAMQRHDGGIAVRFEQGQMFVNPLVASYGEQDTFR